MGRVTSGMPSAAACVSRMPMGSPCPRLALDDDVIARLEAAGADACGEEGEYHTMVTQARLFSRPVPLAWDGTEERDGHFVLKFS